MMRKLILFNLIILILMNKTVLSQNITNITVNQTNVTQNNLSTIKTDNSSSTSTIKTTTITLNTTTSLAQCNCNKNGKCDENNKCKCDSEFSGEFCQFKKCDLTACLNNGTCAHNILTNQTTCLCKPSYTGALCEKPLCLDYCYNNGECNATDPTDLKCVCSSSRFSGDRCQFDSCSDKTCSNDCYLDSTCECQCKEKCDKTFCNQNGVCLSNEKKELECKCNIGYSGKGCTVDECKGYCFNGGTCATNESSIYCNCLSEFGGDRCSKSIIGPAKINEKNNMRSVIYGFSLALSLCLLIIGIYYMIQKNYFRRIISSISSATTRLGRNSRNHVPFARTHNNFSFNKLEDEQGIIHSETMLN